MGCRKMALSFVINIDPGEAGATFAPQTQKANAGDVITWANNDQTNAHWPGLTADATGPVIDPKYFMDHQIAPDGESDEFRPGVSGTLNYACSLHPDERGILAVS
jgi:plastocyanin